MSNNINFNDLKELFIVYKTLKESGLFDEVKSQIGDVGNEIKPLVESFVRNLNDIRSDENIRLFKKYHNEGNPVFTREEALALIISDNKRANKMMDEVRSCKCSE